jgi:hypothetical protein
MWKIFSVPCGSALYKFHCITELQNSSPSNVGILGSSVEGFGVCKVKERRLVSVEWIHLAQDKNQYQVVVGPRLCSSGQSSWLQIRRPGFDSRYYQKKNSRSGTGSTQPLEYN